MIAAGWFHKDPDDTTSNLNYVEVLEPEGQVAGRFDKVRTVPFGEFVPLRGLVERFAKNSLPARDVRPGTEPAVIETSLGKLGVVVSWEVFFEERAREAAEHQAGIILNPTNGASYWLTQVQSQQASICTHWLQCSHRPFRQGFTTDWNQRTSCNTSRCRYANGKYMVHENGHLADVGNFFDAFRIRPSPSLFQQKIKSLSEYLYFDHQCCGTIIGQINQHVLSKFSCLNFNPPCF